MVRDGEATAESEHESERSNGARRFFSVVLQCVGWLIVLGGGGYALVTGRDAATVAAVVGTGFISIIVSQLHEFEALKGGGFELRRVREERREVRKDRRAVEEARAEAVAARESVRKLAAGLAGIVLPMVAEAGLIGHHKGIREKTRQRDELRALLASGGVPPEEVAAMVEGFNAFLRMTLATRLTNELAKLGDGKDHSLGPKIRGLADFKAARAPSAESLADLMETHGLESEKADSLLAELERFEATEYVSDTCTE